MGNQYYLIFENPLEQNDEINFGFRVDNLFGNDWQFNHMHGLFEQRRSSPTTSPATTPPSSTARSTCRILTKGGIDVKGGRFYTIAGYEVVPATGRPLLSVPYMFNYGQPFTHFGMLSTLHLTDKINVYNGAINGWDRWINEQLQVGLHRRLHLDLQGRQDQPGLHDRLGPEPVPQQFPANAADLPDRLHQRPVRLAGRRNPGYARQRPDRCSPPS